MMSVVDARLPRQAAGPPAQGKAFVLRAKFLRTLFLPKTHSKGILEFKQICHSTTIESNFGGTMNLFRPVLVGLALLGAAAFAQVTDFTEVASASQHQAHLLPLFGVGGVPQNSNSATPVKILVNHAYAVGYSEDRRCPLWAIYHSDKFLGKSEPDSFVRTQFFFADSRVTPSIDGRTFGGGMDRGHMVPNAAIATQYGSLAQLETFYKPNMCP